MSVVYDVRRRGGGGGGDGGGNGRASFPAQSGIARLIGRRRRRRCLLYLDQLEDDVFEVLSCKMTLTQLLLGGNHYGGVATAKLGERPHRFGQERGKSVGEGTVAFGMGKN